MTPEVLEIKRKYLRPPTVAEILSFVKEVGVQYTHFEAYYGMAEGTIKNVKCGNKSLPVRYWPIFYEKIIPPSETFISKKIYRTVGVSKKVSIISNKSKVSINHERVMDIGVK